MTWDTLSERRRNALAKAAFGKSAKASDGCDYADENPQQWLDIAEAVCEEAEKDRQAKVTEFQQVAAIVCLDLDLLHEMSKEATQLEELRDQVQHAFAQMEVAMNDPEVRASRFAAASAIFSLVSGAKPGQIAAERNF